MMNHGYVKIYQIIQYCVTIVCINNWFKQIQSDNHKKQQAFVYVNPYA